jgi:hypothetical protein
MYKDSLGNEHCVGMSDEECKMKMKNSGCCKESDSTAIHSHDMKSCTGMKETEKKECCKKK